MLKNHIDIRLKYEKFVKNVCATGIVYALESKTGIARSSSTEYEDDEGNAIPLTCVWSQAAYARACATNGWEGYTVKEIPLNKFMENWCVGMHYDGVLTGVEFDKGMFGMETEPLELLADIITELKATGKEVELENYEDLNELEEIVNQFLDDM